MSGIPMLAFAGYSGSGKTTLIEKLVRSLNARGLRIAVIKHDGHRFEIDHEGKDSWRFSEAGADISIISSSEKTAVVEKRELTFAQVAAKVHDVDLILVEGYKNEPLTQIGICRRASGKGFTAPLDRYIAVVTDLESEIDDPGFENSDVDFANASFMHKGTQNADKMIDIPRFDFEEIQELTEFIMKNMNDFTHFNDQGRARMVNVGEKEITCRTAAAGARVLVSRETFSMIKTGGMKKGDVLTVAQIAGVMGAKKTPDLIPMCHPVQISGIDLELSLNEERLAVEIKATVSCEGKTGVEMEALTAASTAALTVYDMCKAVQKDIMITDIRLIEKTGGIHGDFRREEN